MTQVNENYVKGNTAIKEIMSRFAIWDSSAIIFILYVSCDLESV